jgi:transposase-like protein
MRHSHFLDLVKKLDGLNPAQVDTVLRRLSDPMESESLGTTVLLGKPECCPRCRKSDIRPWGFRSGVPRYRCRSCNSAFNPVSGSPLAGLRYKDKWLVYAKCLLESKTIRACAKECGISIPTAFRWRHRFLKMLDELKPSELKGIIEVDETLFLASKKGDRHLGRSPRKRGGTAEKPGQSPEQVRVLVARDRNSSTTDFIVPNGTASAVESVLASVIADDSILCTDGSLALAAFAERQKIFHLSLNLSAGERVVLKTFHIQNVNAYHSRLKKWMERFNGVSTKWLSRYLGWWRILDSMKDRITPSHIMNYSLSNKRLNH